MSQSPSYDLKRLETSKYFYNTLGIGNIIYFGTNQGVFKLLDGKIKLHNKEIVGPIAVENGNIEAGTVRVSNQFSNILPREYKEAPKNVYINQDILYLTVKGKLFVFDRYDYDLNSIGSVRAITENYIGTYGGVIRKGDSSKILNYTNSYIREYDKATFICWDGLYVFCDSIKKNYHSGISSGVNVKGKQLGIAKDIIEIEHPNYLINTDKGFFNINIIEDEATLISNDFSEVNFVNWFEKPKSISNETLFSYKNKIFSINLLTFDISTLFEFQNEITSVYANGLEEIYILLDSSLIRFNKYNGEQSVIMENLRLVNDVGVFENFVFVTTDLGLHLYDRYTKVIQKNVLNDELNKKAFFIGKDTLFLGGVNGLYKFDYSGISNLFLTKVNQSKPVENSFIQDIIKLKWQILSCVLLLLVISNLMIYKKYKNEQKLKYVVSVDLKSDIEKYINENISSVNIETIKSTFNLSNNQLYSYMGNVNPGEVIRRKRVSLVKKLRKANTSEQEISTLTGFSISYLKKI